MTPEAQEAFLTTLSEQGEDLVRRNLSRGAYPTWQAQIAQAFLATCEDARMERSQAESLRIAKSAKNAAWAAAIAAIIAVPIATASIVIAYLAWASPHH